MGGNYGPDLEGRLLPSSQRFRQVMDVIFQSMRVAVPAVVHSFSPGPPTTVSVLVATKELAERNRRVSDVEESETFELSSAAIALPLIQDVPVLIPSAGGFSLTFPIAPGDECLLVFSDTAIDTWLQNGCEGDQPVSPSHPLRRHSLSDAIAIFGLRSKPKAITGWSGDSAQLRSDDGSVVVEVAEDKVNITAPTVHITGTDSVVPNVVLGPHTRIDGKLFLTHTHGGVQAGGASTGPVL